MMKALRLCEPNVSGSMPHVRPQSTQQLYHRIASIHHRLASLYHNSYRNQVRRENIYLYTKKRPNFSAANLFQLLPSIPTSNTTWNIANVTDRSTHPPTYCPIDRPTVHQLIYKVLCTLFYNNYHMFWGCDWTFIIFRQFEPDQFWNLGSIAVRLSSSSNKTDLYY